MFSQLREPDAAVLCPFCATAAALETPAAGGASLAERVKRAPAKQSRTVEGGKAERSIPALPWSADRPAASLVQPVSEAGEKKALNCRKRKECALRDQVVDLQSTPGCSNG